MNHRVALQNYKDELATELTNILAFWDQYCADFPMGGYFGRVDNDNMVDIHAPKGLILHARVLWTFSAAFRLTGRQRYRELADHCYAFLEKAFSDKQYGGMYWSVSREGIPVGRKKQAYALAFAMYGYAEYFRITGIEAARSSAISLYNNIEEHFYDKTADGYIEALSENWEALADLRLSDKDANLPKSMNTHLHILEAYTNVFRIWRDPRLKERIAGLLHIFSQRIISPATGNLQLFFTIDWKAQSGVRSFGHDVEAAWLMLEAAEVIGDDDLIEQFRKQAIRTACAAAKGLDSDGGLWYEASENGHLIEEKHWWPQAEAMVGFFTCWEISKQEEWLLRSLGSWTFIKNKMLDKKNGEWYWGVDGSGKVLANEDKAGFWKCPYHNGRACIELIERINNLETKHETNSNFHTGI